MALLIGNDTYRSIAKLERAGADAAAMAAELKRLGFEVLLHSNLDRNGMNQAVGELVQKVADGGVAVIFFAGHGVQIGGSNYLLPIDVTLSSPDDLADQAIDLGRVMSRLARSKAKFSLLVVDACRDNPFRNATGRSVGGARGLTIPSGPDAPDGLIILYSAGINEQALDRLSEQDNDPNGLFTREFIKQFRTPWRRIDDMLRRVRSSVREQARKVGHAQNPAIYDQSNGDFYFMKSSIGAQGASVAPEIDKATFELAYWQTIKDSSNSDELKAYLEAYPNGRFASLARSRLKLATPAAYTLPPLVQTRVGVFLFKDERQSLPLSVRNVVIEDLRKLDDILVEEVASDASLNIRDFDFEKWGSKFDIAIIGEALKESDTRFELRFRVLEVKTRSQLRGFSLKFNSTQSRFTGHIIADHVSAAVTGSSGAFSSRLAYVALTGSRYELYVSDYDGQAAKVALASLRAVRSVKWSPDGRQLAYVSFENLASPAIFIHDLELGRRQLVTQVNASASVSWNPDGTQLIVSESGQDTGEVYAITLAGLQRTPISSFVGTIDDIAVSPDGAVVVSTRERSGLALYAFQLGEPKKERIPIFDKGNLTSFVVLAGTRKIALAMAAQGQETLYILDRDTEELKSVIRAEVLRRVTASPDGKLLSVAREGTGISQIVQTSPDGRETVVPVSAAGKILDVSWGPRINTGGLTR